MLLRGHKSLRFILGRKLYASYVHRIQLMRGPSAAMALAASATAGTAEAAGSGPHAGSALELLRAGYPNSFDYAMICHGAIFLLNLKIQLVEEYLERGLVMTNDAYYILQVLKHQLTAVAKVQPHLF
ncbi:hypothetical protein GNI_102740 [Gregarina niphandrodes]|uniref:Uncharacterized protein n=1 Tax=Gregarina niphandrodes TaxID=110365 RepID=A0A023B4C4_GRENI|nr:hypothetical protein GNI_102740 [Gregarina niphandrodes]EZG56592.1 hypothetical protein GNI_102740 [Gregarina niphandrodes]|eukprot:XP_011131227.1 hypothetical protein GNI_102740 [Gregarina niphandrodes]